MSMMIHEYHCSVCQGSFGTRKEWLSHLLESNHQTKARKEIRRWDQSERECVLVAFTTFSIASFDLLQFFSEGSTNLVTDFVWFADRPELGFVQFESKHKVDEILYSFGGPEVRINNQLVQIKKGGDCLGLEWQLLTKLTASADVDEFESILDSEVQKSTSPLTSGKISSSINIASVDKAISGRNGPQIENSASVQPVLGEGAAKPTHSMVDNYHSICQMIEIPDDEYNAALQFLNTLQTLFAKQFPECELIWYRNWYLKLKTTLPLNQLVFFLDQKGIYTALVRNSPVNIKINRLPPLKDEIKKVFAGNPQDKRRAIIKASVKNSPDLLYDPSHQSYRCRSDGLTFGVVATPVVLPEIQACRLVSYLCSFDRRVKPLITVIRYWAKVNNVRLAKPKERSVGYPSDPAALDWLVVFFLTHKMKILPSPREIGKLPHPKLNFERKDIGFAEDPTFAHKFYSRYEESDDEVHVCNIFNLVDFFFHFYSRELNLNEEKLVFNTKDGEIIPMKEFVKDLNSKDAQLKLHHEEWKLAKRGRIGEKLEPTVILLHPLYLRHGFSFCDKTFVTSVCPAMQITEKKLKQALDNYKSGAKFDMASALKVN